MKLELVIPDVIAKSERLPRLAYLLASVLALLLLRRAKDSTIPRENALGVFAALVPTELPHKLMALNAAAIYFALKKQLPLLDSWTGSAGAVLHGVALAKLVRMYHTNVEAKAEIREGMMRLSDIPNEKLWRIGEMTPTRWLSVLLPLPQPMALALSFPGVSKVRTVTYAHVGLLKTTRLKMDVYKHRDTKPYAPILLYIHGGGWVIGNRRLPPLPLVYQVASLGWIVCSIDYRLSPMVAFPSHLIDSKRALAVRGCVDTYGVHDFTDRNGIYWHRDHGENFVKYIELLVMQKKLRNHRDEFEAASPIVLLDADRDARRETVVPPFLISHGVWDTLVPIKDSRLFYDQLVKHRERTKYRMVGGVRDVFLPIESAHHMFNYLVSPRTLAHGDAVCAFLDNLYAKTKHLPRSTRRIAEPNAAAQGVMAWDYRMTAAVSSKL
ncbi:hypothetical protein PybrP1_011731 [[Pythium] brassicae (nom. inval.)]|nr:hypothetical protein PybrP1_011731 [[Pythium] brassicae (nom. inval.)]